MLGDVWNNRQMEVEAIVGNPVRMARENDVEVVKLEALYILIKLKERSWDVSGKMRPKGF